MLSSLTKAFRQITDPAFRRVFFLSFLTSLAVFALLWWLSWLGLAWAGEALNDWLAADGGGGFWQDSVAWLFSALTVAGVLVASFFLFPVVMVLAMSFLLEDIAAAVEQRHYPDLPAGREQVPSEAITGALNFLAVSLLLNLLALPFYLLLMFLPPLNLLLFYLLNGYLLGREYFELVASRRLDAAAARRLRKRYRGRVLTAGAIVAFMLTIPLLNLLTPIVATGFMVHVFEGLRRREAAGDTDGRLLQTSES